MSSYQIPGKIQRLGEDIHTNQLRYHHKRVALTKEFTFDSAHHLHQYEGKCKSLHGHTYRLFITISGYVNDRGFVLDFSDLKKIFKEYIELKCDHRYLNESLPPMNTTVENMIYWVWEQIETALGQLPGVRKDQEIRLEEVKLYETPTSYATLKREWVEENE
ncbi:6-carboxytetrahydropterin synthase QueD [Thermoactinomyces mirandus]|uniref:6-carboxy-5,6,7,8-tetrahydropterin synthase n=1 Tax=Thermoactinomyces mirandus TaxID=2756294 RepID=A0A7W1XPP7_9BACL|nr:6-carboxytetrahydropterin synthase QueD [Thermoactinomyces mirandus]MBA4600993.1 6-carboxytetrahydropterin synthase QueD [Thermoactinomyces mirandus]